ncbi:nitrogen fixation protein NifZ [Methylophaga sp.]|uniref:nitrogen fixation protein NifZ n=1 Tax=Methylophaga sp. TaxID=2024840 RepID=UPI00272246E6|nr:nitrogen fixation protein NifZ [Methylophaga sp.]MDO8828062.1 nitrogen fixation protein NifZ [Methylophaga sp.]
MKFEDLEIGDVVYAAHDIVDDGSMPDKEMGDILAEKGSRGVVVNLGHLEEQPTTAVFLVRFENEALVLGSPIGCLKEDLKLEA